MVLSASSVSAFAEYGDSFLFVQRQAAYAVVGVLALRPHVADAVRGVEAVGGAVPDRDGRDARPRADPGARHRGVRRVALVPSRPRHGAAVGDREARPGRVRARPRSLATWKKLDDLEHLALPLLPVSVLVCGLVMMQPDLGTTVILAVTTFFLLFAAGVRLRYLTRRGRRSAPRSAPGSS